MSFILTQQYPYYGFVQLSSVFQLLLCGAQAQSILKFQNFLFCLSQVPFSSFFVL